MQVIEQTVYEYHELSDKAKDAVRCMLIQHW
jgi:diacylglycerol kinase